MNKVDKKVEQVLQRQHISPDALSDEEKHQLADELEVDEAI